MKRYLVLRVKMTSDGDAVKLSSKLNEMAESGWRVVALSGRDPIVLILLEREQ
ncbi:MAG: hypothetical protein QXW32_06420 [Nitrososphaerales archaeon]